MDNVKFTETEKIYNEISEIKITIDNCIYNINNYIISTILYNYLHDIEVNNIIFSDVKYDNFYISDDLQYEKIITENSEFILKLIMDKKIKINEMDFFSYKNVYYSLSNEIIYYLFSDVNSSRNINLNFHYKEINEDIEFNEYKKLLLLELDFYKKLMNKLFNFIVEYKEFL